MKRTGKVWEDGTALAARLHFLCRTSTDLDRPITSRPSLSLPRHRQVDSSSLPLATRHLDILVFICSSSTHPHKQRQQWSPRGGQVAPPAHQPIATRDGTTNCHPARSRPLPRTSPTTTSMLSRAPFTLPTTLVRLVELPELNTPTPTTSTKKARPLKEMATTKSPAVSVVFKTTQARHRPTTSPQSPTPHKLKMLVACSFSATNAMSGSTVAA